MVHQTQLERSTTLSLRKTLLMSPTFPPTPPPIWNCCSQGSWPFVLWSRKLPPVLYWLIVYRVSTILQTIKLKLPKLKDTKSYVCTLKKKKKTLILKHQFFSIFFLLFIFLRNSHHSNHSLFACWYYHLIKIKSYLLILIIIYLLYVCLPYLILSFYSL